MASEVKSNFKVTNGVMTKYLTIGGGLETNASKIYVVIPGNPGMVHFYETFMSNLYAKLGGSDSGGVAIWCVGHAGHDVYDDPPLAADNGHLFNVDGQIKHKFEFLKENVREGAEVTMIGHSVGCHFIMEVMKLCDQHTNIKTYGYMLFPMMERMYELRSGKNVWILAAYLRWLACSVAWILNLLPAGAKESVLRVVHPCEDPPSFETIVQLVHPARFTNVLHLARHEVLEISHSLDVAAIQKFKDRLWFFYGPTDNWAPTSYYHNLVQQVPGVRAELGELDHPLPHAFVLNKNEEVADIVAKWHHSRT